MCVYWAFPVPASALGITLMKLKKRHRREGYRSDTRRTCYWGTYRSLINFMNWGLEWKTKAYMIPSKMSYKWRFGAIKPAFLNEISRKGKSITRLPIIVENKVTNECIMSENLQNSLDQILKKAQNCCLMHHPQRELCRAKSLTYPVSFSDPKNDLDWIDFPAWK